MRKYVIIGLLGLAAASAAWAYGLSQQNPAPGSLEFEFAKMLLQVGVVGVAGAVISLLSFEYQQERHRSEKDRESAKKSEEYRESLVMSTLSTLMAEYIRAKKARRLLRARGTAIQDGTVILLLEQYDVYLEWINDAQLALEDLVRDIDTSAQAFSEHEKLKRSIRTMEKYFNTLVKEYKAERPIIAGARSENVPLLRLPRLQDFLRPSEENQFHKSVVEPYKEAQKALRANLLHPNLPRPS